MTSPGPRPRLRRGVRLIVDRPTGRPILLAPERGLVLDAAAHAVVALLDGTRTLDEIVNALAEVARAPRARVRADVDAFLAELAARRMIEGAPP